MSVFVTSPDLISDTSNSSDSSKRSLGSATFLIMVSIPIALFLTSEAVINYSIAIAP